MKSSSLVCLAVACLLGAWMAIDRVADRGSEADPSAASTTRDASESNADDGAGVQARQRSSRETTPEVEQEGSLQEPPEDERSAAWDSTMRNVRVDALVAELEAALDRIRDGTDVEHNLRLAGDALSVLRADMYASGTGRARHVALEQELDALTVELHEPASSNARGETR